MRNVFLEAEWRNLLIANYECDESRLLPFLPEGTELDTYENKNLVSLVAFLFMKTKVWGVRWPFHVNFEEVNLRFYVKRKMNNEIRRGVVFIKEIVPKPLISYMANTLYNENYATMPTEYSCSINKQGQLHKYTWGKKKLNSFECLAESGKLELQKGSLEEFITEHYWGYAKGKSTTEYQVFHPRWRTSKIVNYKLICDFGKIYGEPFEFFNTQNTHSVLLAEGSAIKVYRGLKL